MQGRRTFILIDEWLTRYVTNLFVRTALMVTGLVLLNVFAIAAAAGLVELLTWMLSAAPK